MGPLKKNEGVLSVDNDIKVIVLNENNSCLKLSMVDSQINEDSLPSRLFESYRHEAHMLEQVISHPSFKIITMPISSDNSMVTLQGYQDSLKVLIEFMEANAINPSLLEFLFVGVYRDASGDESLATTRIKMKPNGICPVISVIGLKKIETALVNGNNHLKLSRYQKLLDIQKGKLFQLESCHDRNFVKQQKKDLDNEVKIFEKENRIDFMETVTNAQTFYSYLQDIGLKEFYRSFELISQN